MSIGYIHEKHWFTWTPLTYHERMHLGALDAKAWDEIGAMDNAAGCYPLSLVPNAGRFDIGGRPNPVVMSVLHVSLSMLIYDWTIPRIHSYITSLNDYVVDRLEPLIAEGWINIPEKAQRSGHILGILILPRALWEQEEVVQEMKLQMREAKIKISVRYHWLRVAPYIYNTLQDMKALCQVIEQVIKKKAAREE